MLAAHPGEFFTIPHFDGFSAVLIQLGEPPRAGLISGSPANGRAEQSARIGRSVTGPGHVLIGADEDK